MATEPKFNRFIRVLINKNEVEIRDLRIVFRIERFPGDSVHTMNVDIYNLESLLGKADPSIQSFDTIQLDAGYEEIRGTLFKGIIRNIETFRDDTEIVTRAYCRDSNSLDAPVARFSSSGSVSLADVISDIAFNADIEIADYGARPLNIDRSLVINKPFNTIMNEFAESFDLTWHVLNGELYVYDAKKGNVSRPLFHINSRTGLLETPVLTTIGINVKMLLEPGIKPRDRFEVESGGLNFSQSGLEYSSLVQTGLGPQQVQSLAHTGDTHGEAWFTEIIGQKLNA